MNIKKIINNFREKAGLVAAMIFIASLFLFAGCDSQTRGCTEEAKICPDGSSVGRTGPNCEFAECPGSENTANINNVELSEGSYFEYEFDPESKITTLNFASDDDFKNFVSRYENSGYYGGYYGGGGIMFEESMEMAVDSVAPMVKTASGDDGTRANAVATDYSVTNNQVAAVDEADILKTDGEYIYTITNGVLYIVKAYPGEDSEVVSTINLDDYNPQSLFINGDKLAIFGGYHDNDYFNEIGFKSRNGMTFFNVYDISDKADPELVKEYKFEGYYFNGRMKGEYIYMFTKTGVYDRPIPMPIIVEDDVMRNVKVSDIYYYPIDYNSPEFVNIHSINIADLTEDIESKSVAVEGGQNLYVSEENIFITYTEWLNEYQLEREIQVELLKDKVTTEDKILIAKIKKTDNDVLNNAEKKAKIEQIYMSYMSYMTNDEREEFYDEVESLLKEKLESLEYLEYTVVHRIAIDGNKITPAANGKVPGRIVNQFSLDEDSDVLRIATTISERWSRFNKVSTESVNNIYALDEDLEIIGSLVGLAENERIYSTRFIQDRLYMVTFRQVDPFFVIDLSDPTDIKELGQLKIPGFSRYLHPYDDNVIIGIGQDATETGRTTGLKISLFDVSDVENPEEIAKYVTEERYASSNAFYEHKAFLFSKEKNLLVIPVYNYDYRGNDGYNGAFVFDISEDDIELRGLVDHNTGTSYGPQVERSLYIEELLYTKSPNLLRINALDDLHSVKNITLSIKQTGIPVY